MEKIYWMVAWTGVPGRLLACSCSTSFGFFNIAFWMICSHAMFWKSVVYVIKVVIGLMSAITYLRP